MENIITKSLEKSCSYKGYREIITAGLEKAKADSGQADDYTHYTLLNETRMNRIEKTVAVADDVKQVLQSLRKRFTWLVISEGWCGDAAQIVPILSMMAGIAPNIAMKMVFRDENEELMDLFLTNGSRSIPKLIVIDEEGKVVADWGPRPKGASDLVKNYKLQHGVFDEQAKTDLQMWYLHDKGISTQNEIADLMKQLVR